MKALSLSQPWLWVIELFAVDPDGKGIENRTWMPPISMIGQRFALHAAKSWDASASRFIFEKLAHRPDLLAQLPGARARYTMSAITCTVVLDRVVTEDRTLPKLQKGWFVGPCGWVLRDLQKIASPVPCDGKLGLWDLPTALEMAVLGQGQGDGRTAR